MDIYMFNKKLFLWILFSLQLKSLLAKCIMSGKLLQNVISQGKFLSKINHDLLIQLDGGSKKSLSQ